LAAQLSTTCRENCLEEISGVKNKKEDLGIDELSRGETLKLLILLLIISSI
jgi:hypothetical protein